MNKINQNLKKNYNKNKTIKSENYIQQPLVISGAGVWRDHFPVWFVLWRSWPSGYCGQPCLSVCWLPRCQQLHLAGCHLGSEPTENWCKLTADETIPVFAHSSHLSYYHVLINEALSFSLCLTNQFVLGHLPALFLDTCSSQIYLRSGTGARFSTG